MRFFNPYNPILDTLVLVLLVAGMRGVFLPAKSSNEQCDHIVRFVCLISDHSVADLKVGMRYRLTGDTAANGAAAQERQTHGASLIARHHLANCIKIYYQL